MKDCEMTLSGRFGAYFTLCSFCNIFFFGQVYTYLSPTLVKFNFNIPFQMGKYLYGRIGICPPKSRPHFGRAFPSRDINRKPTKLFPYVNMAAWANSIISDELQGW